MNIWTMPKIDSHCHVSQSKFWDLHTEKGDLPDIKKFADKYNIHLIILLATYFPFKSSTGWPNKKLFNHIKDNPRFKMFPSLDVMNDFKNGLTLLEEFLQRDICIGIKLYAGYQTFEFSHPDMFPIYELARKHNVPVGVHGGELHHCCQKSVRISKSRPLPCNFDTCQIDNNQHLSHPDAFEGAIKAFPDVNFIIYHYGNPHFQRVREIMMQYPNAYTGISGQFVSGLHIEGEDTPEYREHLRVELQKLVDIPGLSKRLLFGTDFPIQSYEDSIKLIEGLKLSDDQLKDIMYRNSIRVHNLDLNLDIS